MGKFTLEDAAGRGLRLVAREQLSPSDFDAVAVALGVKPRKAKKAGFVAARRVEREQKIDTLWNGKESSNTAQPGDRIVANMSAARQILRDAAGNPNIYVITASKFAELYERDEGHTEFGDVYRSRATGVVKTLYLPGGFELKAPWGEDQRAGAGYLLLNQGEVYGNNKETFEETYVEVP